MESLNISENKKDMIWDYDADADVLYITLGEPKNAEGIDIGEGTIIRMEPGSQEIVGITIINPVHRTLSSLKDKPPSFRRRKPKSVSKA